MTCTLHVAWDGRLAGYDFGPGHPMAPLRLRLTMELAQALGLGRQDGVTVAVPAAATDAELELVHDPAYIAMVRLAGHQAAGGGPSGDLTTRRAARARAGHRRPPAVRRHARGVRDGDRRHAGRGPGGLDLGHPQCRSHSAPPPACPTTVPFGARGSSQS
jgi:acetoin utilization deacetylase AcuC-like enzyme